MDYKYVVGEAGADNIYLQIVKKKSGEDWDAVESLQEATIFDTITEAKAVIQKYDWVDPIIIVVEPLTPSWKLAGSDA
jgi:hypothetical protein